MENVKNYNYNVKTADSMLEPIELFFINKFNHEGAPKMDFLEMGNNIVHVLYFKDEKSCEYYKCFVFKDDFQDDNGNTKYYFKFKVEKREECCISENIKLELSKLPNRCIFLFPYSRVELAEPIKKYTDPAAPEDEVTLLPELGNLAVAEKCTPIDKVCAKLILDNKDVKFAYSTLPENKKKWLSAKSGLYSIDDALFNGGVNIEKIKSENDAYESENSESKHYTMRDLYKMPELKIEKGKQIEFKFNIKYVNGTQTTLQKILTSAGIEGDFYLRFLPDGFARVYILLGDKKDELKAVAYMYTYRQKDAEETEIKVVKIPKPKTDSDKVTLSGATPTKDADKAKGAKAKGDVADNSARAIVNENIESDFSKLDLRRAGSSVTTKVNVMVRLYPAITWFVIVVREFIDRCYKEISNNNNPQKMMISHFEEKIKYNECIDKKAQLQAENKMTNKGIEKKLYELYPYYSEVKSWSTKKYRVEKGESLYDINNCNVFFDILGDSVKLNGNDCERLAELSELAKKTTDTRNSIAHYDLNTIDPETDIECEIKKIKDFIEYLNGFDLCRGQFDLHMSEVEKLLVQPVSIKYCPRCGEELPGGEYTFRLKPKG